jgi:preprotein translocase subunit SecE
MANPVFTYIKESKDELKKVSWPSRSVVIRDTLIVIAISFAMAVFFGAIDYGLSAGLEKIITQ